MTQINNVQLEQLVELITKQVLIALNDQAANPGGKVCNCDGTACVRDCTADVHKVMNAGAVRITSGVGAIPHDLNLAGYIDHTLLKPDASDAQIAQLCYEARKYNFAAVCVNPSKVKLCAQLLKDTPVKIATVVGFPLGATPPEVKAYETQQAIEDGANEIDMVINIGAVKSQDYSLVGRDIATVVRTAQAGGAITKVIIEAALLTDEEKVVACKLAKEAGAEYVKTSTGFASGGATVHDVALMRQAVGPTMGVKAAGGIRTHEDALKMIEAGATRIGASASVKIMQQAGQNGDRS
jgi:deoxyribose-phosphate aldolase